MNVRPMSHGEGAETTTMSSKGQVVLPRALRQRVGWKIGDKLTVEATADGLLLRLQPRRPPSRLEDVVGILKWKGPHAEMDDIRREAGQAMAERWRRIVETGSAYDGEDEPSE